MPKSKILSAGDVAESNRVRNQELGKKYVFTYRTNMRRHCVRGSLPAVCGPAPQKKNVREFCLSAGVDKDHDLERGNAKSHKGKKRRRPNQLDFFQLANETSKVLLAHSDVN